MNQDITAPADSRVGQIGGFLSDATAEQELHQHAQAARNNLKLGEFGVLSRRPFASTDLSPLRNMVFMVSAAVHTCNAAFVPLTAATFGDVSSAIYALRTATKGARLHAETTSELVDLSIISTDNSLRTLPERFMRALGEWRGLLAPDHFDRMAQHVDRLLSDEEEIGEDNIVPSPSSFDDMLAFLSGRPWDKAPAVGLNRKGQFSVSWGKPRPQVDVTLTFLGEGSVKWYVYGLGRRATGSAAGTSDRADVTTILSRLGCDEWMAR